MAGLKRRFFTLCLVLALALGLWAAADSLASLRRDGDGPLPAPSPSAGEGPALAFFGDSADGWCQPLFGQLDSWAEEQGWAFLSYDRQGRQTAGKGQLEDLARREQADVAVVYRAEEDWLGPLLDAGIPVILLGGGDVPGAACRVGAAPGEPYRAVGRWLGQGAKALLIADLPDDPELEEAREALEAEGVQVLHLGACWSNSTYAGDYLDWALPVYPEATGIVAFSRAGALGASEKLGTDRELQIVCLESGPGALDDLALGKVDAVAEVSARDALQALGKAIPAALSGTPDALYELKATLLP